MLSHGHGMGIGWYMIWTQDKHMSHDMAYSMGMTWDMLHYMGMAWHTAWHIGTCSYVQVFQRGSPEGERLWSTSSDGDVKHLCHYY